MVNNWPVVTLGEVIEIKYGKDHKKLNEGLIPCYGSGGIMRYVCEFLYDQESILIPRKGSLNNIYYLEQPFWTVDTLFWSKVNKTMVDAKFLFYQLKLTDFNRLNEGSAVPSLTVPILNNIKIKLPSLNVQKKISKVLSVLDDKIELNHQTNQTLEKMAQALFKSWFVDFDPVIDNALAAGKNISDFPEPLQKRAELRKIVQQSAEAKKLPEDIRKLFPSEFEESELGWVPKGWEINSIHDMVDTISKTYPLKDVDEVIFLNTGDIEDGRILHNKYSKTEGLPGQAKKSISNGDILYSEIRPKNKRFAYVNIDASDYVVSTKLMVLRAKNDLSPLLPYFILTQERTIQNLQHVAEHRSGTFPQITFKELESITTALPKNNVLVEYFVDQYLKPFYNKMFSSTEQNDELISLRDTLLPELISGEITLNKEVA